MSIQSSNPRLFSNLLPVAIILVYYFLPIIPLELEDNLQPGANHYTFAQLEGRCKIVSSIQQYGWSSLGSECTVIFIIKMAVWLYFLQWLYTFLKSVLV